MCAALARGRGLVFCLRRHPARGPTDRSHVTDRAGTGGKTQGPKATLAPDLLALFGGRHGGEGVNRLRPGRRASRGH